MKTYKHIKKLLALITIVTFSCSQKNTETINFREKNNPASNYELIYESGNWNHPNYTRAFRDRAVSYYILGKETDSNDLYEKSILDGLKVIQLDPDNDENRHNVVYAYMRYSRYRLGQYQKALDNFNKVLELDPISEDHDPFYLKNWIPNTKNALSK